jgi:hypothetical protein
VVVIVVVMERFWRKHAERERFVQAAGCKKLGKLDNF